MKRQPKANGPTPLQVRNGYSRNNEAAARLILERPWLYGGEQSFPCLWARLALRRIENDRRVSRKPLIAPDAQVNHD